MGYEEQKEGGALLKKKAVIEKKTEVVVKEDTETEPKRVENVVEQMELSEAKNKKGIIIQLGDVIQVISPSNENLHQHTFLVIYCDLEKIKLIDVLSGFPHTLGTRGKKIDASERVDVIKILHREEYPGYARQNGLLPGVWVVIRFGGDWAYSVTGKITNLEEDRIEINAIQEDVVFYVDFGYNGIPETPPLIESIEIIESPVDMEDIQSSEEKVDTETGESKTGDGYGYEETSQEEAEEAEQNILEELRNEYVQADGMAKDWVPELDIEFGQVLASVHQRLEVAEKDRRFSLIAQKSDLMDELLSTIPNYQRNAKVMNEIEHSIRRFGELHEIYSFKNENGGVLRNRPLNSKFNKPLVGILSRFEQRVPWILPVTMVRKRQWFDEWSKYSDPKTEVDDPLNNHETGYFNVTSENYDQGNGDNESVKNPFMVYLKEIETAIENWKTSRPASGSGINGYKRLLSDLDSAMSPIMDYHWKTRSLGEKRVQGPYPIQDDLECILDASETDYYLEGKINNNLKPYTSSIVQSLDVATTNEYFTFEKQKPFVVQKYVSDLSLLKMNITNSGKKILEREIAIPSEKISLKSFIFLPKECVYFSKIYLPRTNLYEKSSFGHFWPQTSLLLNSNTDIQSVEINDLTREYLHGNTPDTCMRKDLRGKKESEGIPFLSKPQEFKIAKTGVKSIGKINDWLPSFLNTVIPNTCYWIEWVRDHFSENMGSLSLLEYAKHLEPFGLELSSIGFQDARHIQKILRENIVGLRMKLSNHRKIFNDFEIAIQSEKKNYAKSLDVETFYKWFQGKGEKFRSLMIELYGLDFPYLTSSESIQKTMAIDSGVLLDHLISLLSFSFVTPTDFQKGELLDLSMGLNLEEGRYAYSGGKRILSKRYDSYQALLEDNHKTDLYWDKTLDKSPYHLADQYGNEIGGSGSEEISEEMQQGGKTMRQKMSASEFLEYLALNLNERHSCPKNESLELAEILIKGKRAVREGEYASVMLGGGSGNEVGYFRRHHHQWVRDHMIDFGTEGSESRVFSNLSEVGGGLGFGIISNGKKEKMKHEDKEVVVLSADPSKKIERWKETEKESETDWEGGAEERRKKEINKELMKRLFQQKIEETYQTLQEMAQQQFIRTQKIKSLKKTELYRHDLATHALGVLTADKLKNALISPYENLKNMILEHPDFIQKQRRIVDFYHKYCREAIPGMENEIIHWKYCVASNAPLLPTFLYDLALEFCTGGDYSTLLEKICTQIGKLSEDGEAIVDGVEGGSGMIIKKLDYSTEEDYDENGFKKFTRAVIGEENDLTTDRNTDQEREADENEEEDAVDKELEEEDNEDLAERIENVMIQGYSKQKVQKLDRIYENENTEQMAKVCNHFLNSMKIKDMEMMEDVLDFVIAVLSDLMADKTFMDDENRFNKKVKLAQKSGKQPATTSYKEYTNQILVYTTICLTLIGLQTTQGEVKSKTFSNCSKSLKGFPAGEGNRDDLSGMRYMACILIQVRIEEEPWNAVPKRKEDAHITKMQTLIQEKLLKIPLILERIERKRVERETQKTEVVPVIPSQEWSEFRPPLIPSIVLDGRDTQSVSQLFIAEWKEEMKRSLKKESESRGIIDKTNVIRMKLLSLGLGVLEKINATVRKEENQFAMKTAAGVAFLENACCQNAREEDVIPLKYFAQKEPEMVSYLKSSNTMNRWLKWSEDRKKTVTLFHSEPTRVGMIMNAMKSWSSYYKDNIYMAIIHYFHYNRPTPVPEYLKSVYEEAPKNYPKTASLKEQREWLEKEGRHYDLSKLQECMTLVNRHNILSNNAGLIINEPQAEKGLAQGLADFLTDADFEWGTEGKEKNQDLITVYTLFREVLNAWKPGTMQLNSAVSPISRSGKFDEKILNLNFFLAEMNSQLIAKIRGKLRPRTSTENARIQFLEQVQRWNLTAKLDEEGPADTSNSDTLHSVVENLRRMCEVFLSYTPQTYDKDKITIPKRWGFDLKHNELLQKFIEKGLGEFPGLETNKMNSNLPLYLEMAQTKEQTFFRQIRLLMSIFPVFTPLVLIEGSDAENDRMRSEFYALFPKETCIGLYVFCLYSILWKYLDYSQDIEVIQMDKNRERMRSRQSKAHQSDAFTNDLRSSYQVNDLMREERDDNEFHETGPIRQWTQGMQENLEMKIRSLIFAFLDTEMDKKEIVDKTYKQLKRDQEKTQEREKLRITDRLKKMNIYERNVEKTLRQFKLGKWGVGNEKGLFRYDKETFVREMEEQLGYSGPEGDLQEGEVMNSEAIDTNIETGLDLEMGAMETERELDLDIMGLSEDWVDGEYGYDSIH